MITCDNYLESLIKSGVFCKEMTKATGERDVDLLYAYFLFNATNDGVELSDLGSWDYKKALG